MERSLSGRKAALAGMLLLIWAMAGHTAGEPPATEPPRFEPVLPGTTEEQLRARFGPSLREIEITPLRSAHEQAFAAASPEAAGAAEQPATFADQTRLARPVVHSNGEGDVQSVEYDVFRGVVYRTRWQLGERFERPLMEPLVTHLSGRLGAPDYDQTLEAKLGSGRSELRRSGWHRGDQWLEVRQLHPATGGPIFITLSDRRLVQSIVDARAVAIPQPESVGDWWGRPQKTPSLLGGAERDRLLAAVDALLARIDF
jgi:hypothetical protein